MLKIFCDGLLVIKSKSVAIIMNMTVPCDNGLLNIRVGAIIMKNGKILMVENKIRPEYLYSVGGRIKFGETAEEAVIREVLENFEPISQSFTEDGHAEFLKWITLDSSIKYYPEFFRTELAHPQLGVKHLVSDER